MKPRFLPLAEEFLVLDWNRRVVEILPLVLEQSNLILEKVNIVVWRNDIVLKIDRAVPENHLIPVKILGCLIRPLSYSTSISFERLNKPSPNVMAGIDPPSHDNKMLLSNVIAAQGRNDTFNYERGLLVEGRNNKNKKK